MSPDNITQKLWNYCHDPLEDGMHFNAYVEQLTYLLFLKMADERTPAPYNQGQHRTRVRIPAKLNTYSGSS